MTTGGRANCLDSGLNFCHRRKFERQDLMSFNFLRWHNFNNQLINLIPVYQSPTVAAPQFVSKLFPFWSNLTIFVLSAPLTREVPVF